MSVQQITVPPMLDSTGLSIVQKLDQIKEAVSPTNSCLDIDISLPTTGWSGNGPYTYTYSNEHITSGCSVKVNFLESSVSGNILCLEYEKVVGGVQFSSSSVPTQAIPVRLHILNADADSVMATTADEVSTNAVSGASNVQDALETLNDQIANLLNPVKLTIVKASSNYTVTRGWANRIGKIVIVNIVMTSTVQISADSPLFRLDEANGTNVQIKVDNAGNSEYIPLVMMYNGAASPTGKETSSSKHYISTNITIAANTTFTIVGTFICN